MATSMLAEFTGADRRKKVVTYGRSNRPSASARSAALFHEDGSSPERPRKHVIASSLSNKPIGGLSKASRVSSRDHTPSPSPDPFEVPSDDEATPRPPKSVKRLPSETKTRNEDFDVPDSDDGLTSYKPPRKAVQPLRKPTATKPVASVAQSSVKPRTQTVLAAKPTFDSSTSKAQVAKSGAVTTGATRGTRHGDQAHASESRAKALPRATTPAATVSKIKNSKSKSTTAAISTAPSPASSADIFELPISDDELAVPASRPLRQTSRSASKQRASKMGLGSPRVGQDALESDDSTKLRKRKRQEAIPLMSATTSNSNGRREASGPRRTQKHLKKLGDDRSRQDLQEEARSNPFKQIQPTTASASKLQRSRQRTVSVLVRPMVAKRQSSPANLSSMLPAARNSVPSPEAESTEVEAFEDGTMYEIPESHKTPIRAPQTPTPGSVTPRQKALFNNLLGGSTSSITPMPSLQTLQLTDRKPRSLLGALSRSKSDLTNSPQVRKNRLISALKPAESSSDTEEVEDNTDGSDSELSDIVQKEDVSRERQGQSRRKNVDTLVLQKIEDADMEGVADSQNSQATSGQGARSKFTYASEKRSYLQEFNPEDEFLMSMDLDNNLEPASRGTEGLSGDDDDPSQARAHHELKRQGQQALFNDDAQMHVEDISGDKSTSIRRSAMLDLATKMENASFTSQLLDSSWAPGMIQNLALRSDAVFDFAAAIAIIYLMRTTPTLTILRELSTQKLAGMLLALMTKDTEIRKIAKDRKTNMSRIGQESVGLFRDLAERSIEWCPKAVDKISPQLAALKALDMLLSALHTSGVFDLQLSSDAISHLISIIENRCKILQGGSLSTHDTVTLSLALSILQTISAAVYKTSPWVPGDLQRLAECMPTIFQRGESSSAILAVKICMNLTNNKPKACQPFSGPMLIRSLVDSTVHKFGLQDATVREEWRIEALDTIILNLGTLINLAEFSDKARSSVDDGQRMVKTLVDLFVEGSERADQAETLAESQFGVAIGYLGVLLGNLCLNKTIRAKIRSSMPEKDLGLITKKIKEFIGVHKDVDQARQAEQSDNHETWQNYTARLMHVVDNLERIET